MCQPEAGCSEVLILQLAALKLLFLPLKPLAALHFLSVTLTSKVCQPGSGCSEAFYPPLEAPDYSLFRASHVHRPATLLHSAKDLWKTASSPGLFRAGWLSLGLMSEGSCSCRRLQDKVAPITAATAGIGLGARNGSAAASLLAPKLVPKLVFWSMKMRVQL